MGQRIDARDRQPKVRVELIGDAQGVRLQAEAQEASVAIKRVLGVEDGETLEIADGERDLAEPLGLHPHQANHPGRRAVGDHGLDPHRLAEQRSREDLSWGDGIRVDHNPEPLIER